MTLIGFFAGILVGVTSIGSGSVILMLLLVFYGFVPLRPAKRCLGSIALLFNIHVGWQVVENPRPLKFSTYGFISRR